MSSKPLILLLLWAELKKLYRNQTVGKGRGTRPGDQQLKNPRRNRWRLAIIVICGLLSWQTVTRAQCKLPDVAPGGDDPHTNAPTALCGGSAGSGPQVPANLRPFQLTLFDPTVGAQDYESVLEWTYRFCFRKSAFFIQPDIRYVINPGGGHNLDNALVLGCQIGFNF
jgi:hypothetical protein